VRRLTLRRCLQLPGRAWPRLGQVGYIAKGVALGVVGGPAQLCGADLRAAEGARAGRRAAHDPGAAVREISAHGGGAWLHGLRPVRGAPVTIPPDVSGCPVPAQNGRLLLQPAQVDARCQARAPEGDNLPDLGEREPQASASFHERENAEAVGRLDAVTGECAVPAWQPRGWGSSPSARVPSARTPRVRGRGRSVMRATLSFVACDG
jgi:hypothetical protein